MRNLSIEAIAGKSYDSDPNQMNLIVLAVMMIHNIVKSKSFFEASIKPLRICLYLPYLLSKYSKGKENVVCFYRFRFLFCILALFNLSPYLTIHDLI